jgi:bifunctional DNase/RNase
MTHDLFAATLDAAGVRVLEVHLTDLREGTFFAELHLQVGERTVVVSARPSDALALSIRLEDVPILVDEDLLERVAIELSSLEDGEESVDPEEEVRQFRAFLEDLDPEDFLEG